MTPYYWLRKQLIGWGLFRPGTDVYIISYPKSGRTWLRLLIGKALCDQYQLPASLMLDTYRLTQKAGLPVTHFSHDFSSILSGFPYQHLPRNKRPYAHKKVLFMTRDIRDILVSSYFQATRRTDRFEGTLSEFIRSDKYGVRKVLAFYNSWYAARHIPQAFLHVTYEAMHRDPAAVLSQALTFMADQPPSDNVLQTAVAFASFDNMRKMEAEGHFRDPKMRPANDQDAESYKVRRGAVSGYANYMADADLTYINQTIAQLGCPFTQE